MEVVYGQADLHTQYLVAVLSDLHDLDYADDIFSGEHFLQAVVCFYHFSVPVDEHVSVCWLFH